MGATLGPSPPAKLVELSRGAATRPAAAPGVGLGRICTPLSLRRCPLAGGGIPGPDGADRDPRGAHTSTQVRGSCEPRSAPCGRREGAPSGGSEWGPRVASPPSPRPSDSLALPSRQVHGPEAWAAAGGDGARGSQVPGSVKSRDKGSAVRWSHDTRAKAPVCPAFAVIRPSHPCLSPVLFGSLFAGCSDFSRELGGGKHCCCKGYLWANRSFLQLIRRF